ncbi:DHH family phosphoesterase [Virgibacillus halodenitrificans]|jgi:bifunctional oligoribonuclease and PAP phosphatase NrnA|uniref:DHH family phosphoesterase n=1 Tax=Virgibacillus halodenitrificans TaxID=1482 RepID=UPI000761C248|nr:bifunctional oligoribonuclease/PAP phosphatase NrnA [Virgibacillus halodenitrificans]MEC2159861.1 bifunctional oligoribonuclease/PAP phosphatase NrnA [Virgibacillus halodenitrificans]
MITRQILDDIRAFDTIIIHRHVRPDPDALGSQGALMELIKENFPEKKVYVVGEEDPSLTFLVRMDTIEEEVYEGALVIVCDTANAARICDQRYDLGEKLIKIDHHPNVDTYGDLRWVDTNASSTSEMIYEFYLELQDQLSMNVKAARLIYAGIVGDTGRFLFPSTTTKTFHYAAELVAYDFDRTALYDGIYSMKESIARMRGYILTNYTLSPEGMSTVKLTRDILNEFGVSPVDTGQLVGVLGEVEGIKAWVFFIEEEDLIRVRFRSKGPIVNDIAAKYNGGGHPMAAGASVPTWEEAEKVINDLHIACSDYK